MNKIPIDEFIDILDCLYALKKIEILKGDVVPVFWTDYLITAPLYQLAVLLVSLTFDGESPNLTTMRSSL